MHPRFKVRSVSATVAATCGIIAMAATVSPASAQTAARERSEPSKAKAAPKSAPTSGKQANCPAFAPATLVRPFNVERAYPTRQIERGQEGEVTFRASITETGAVTEVTITQSNPPGVFDSAVLREVARLRFVPAQRRCRPVPDEFERTVTFRLD